MIGGSASSEGNLIGGAAVCVYVGPSALSTVVEGNSIGRCNTAGVRLNSTGTVLGGTAPGSGNTITLSRAGVDIIGDSNVVQGNHILQSVQVDSWDQVRDGGPGARVSGNNNLFGGTTASARNVVSGTTKYSSGGALPAIDVAGRRNTIQGNFIGTNAAGTAPYVWSMVVQVPPYNTITVTGNEGPAISITGSDNQIGGNGVDATGTCTGACNLIAANSGGILLGGGQGNRIEGNSLGLDVSGSAAIPNAGHGIKITSAGGTIGGSGPNAGNVIANSQGSGIVSYRFAQRNLFTRNRIHDNGGLGDRPVGNSRF